MNTIFKNILGLIFLIIPLFFVDHTFASKPSSQNLARSLKIRELAIEEKQHILAKSMLLDVPLINQMAAPRLYNGCEVTSLAMVLNYNGYHVTKNELAEKVKTVPLTYSNGKKGNPTIGFVGDIANGPGLGVYNGPIYDLTQQYAGDKVLNLTNSPFIDLLKKINKKEPVWIITTTKFAPVSVFQNWNTPQGLIKITFSEHSVVITGYDDDYIFINDPYGFKNRKLLREDFEKAWEQMGKQAIVIEDKL
ncbi:C39 family peptidase [Neobacillus sp. PS3-40]|jgi:uncharacterized protein YvpB|uniref:C39 family peptidase n=1 Tax=Neobacillus sp. PS3-40 TaxID=3070679 RepID=UPI0027DF578C|nr:C39 family peptidase [Neobacillus sp. PS3-40]WML42910.1 C39 family peptidase [Neobacillus sp. PS3-40]